MFAFLILGVNRRLFVFSLLFFALFPAFVLILSKFNIEKKWEV